MKRLFQILVIGAFVALLTTLASAQVPQMINYQGKLTDTTGAPVHDTLQMVFSIYSDSAGTTTLWTETQPAVVVEKGVFNVLLGSVDSIPYSVFDGAIRYLGVKVGDDPEITPRKPMVSAAYAFKSLEADTADYAKAAPPIPDADWVINGDTIYHPNGNVGIGTIGTLYSRLHIKSSGTSSTPFLIQSASGTNFIAHIQEGPSSGGSLQLFGTNGATKILLCGYSSSWINYGNFGIGTDNPVYKLDVNGDIRTTGTLYGNADVWDGHNWGDTYPYSSNSDMVDGVHNGGLTADVWDGHHWGDTYPYSSNSDLVDGIHGTQFLRNDQSGTLNGSLNVTGNVGIGTTSPDARLSVLATSDVAASFRNNSSSVVSVWAYNTSGTAISCGTGSSTSYPFQAIAYNNDASKTAIQCNGSLNATGTITGNSILNGVNAITGTCSGNWSGVAGINTASGNGVYGTSASGYAGRFDGNVQINGTLTKSSGSFKIDHPLDPSNKYLSHSFVESPDMMNIYNGNIILDANGEAWVGLPEWFEALNRDFRYQLTAIGQPSPNLYIAEEISGNRFKIAGGTQGMKVSWQVTGVRHDAYAEKHRIQVEEEKPLQERGKYLHPTELGMPETMGINYQETDKK